VNGKIVWRCNAIFVCVFLGQGIKIREEGCNSSFEYKRRLKKEYVREERMWIKLSNKRYASCEKNGLFFSKYIAASFWWITWRQVYLGFILPTLPRITTGLKPRAMVWHVATTFTWIIYKTYSRFHSFDIHVKHMITIRSNYYVTENFNCTQSSSSPVHNCDYLYYFF